MAIVKGLDVTINNASASQDYGYNEQLGIYNYYTTQNGATYIHFKTNLRKNYNTVATIEAIGYNYGQSRDIKASWSFYIGSSLQGATFERDGSSGLSPATPYLSSDDYVVIKASVGNQYFLGVVFNAYTSGAGNDAFGGRVEITAVSKTTSSTAVLF